MRQLVFLCFILLFNCHNAQKKNGDTTNTLGKTDHLYD